MNPVKPALLYLCHRIPYPPNKGDKVRSYHLLKYLTNHYRVYLGAFVDDIDDWQHKSRLCAICEQVYLVKLSAGLSTFKSLRGLFTDKPLSIYYYKNKKLKNWVENIIEENDISRVVVFSSTAAQYVAGSDLPVTSKILDMVDVDSDKWLQYADKKKWPLNWLYHLEGSRLFNYEKEIAKDFTYTFFVSQKESDHFIEKSGLDNRKVGFFYNGVDFNYFNPRLNYSNPYREGELPLVFTGAMDYWPNVDAVEWFASAVFTKLHKENHNYRFYIVGRNPSKQLKALERIKGIVVTGGVKDIRPFIVYASAMVAPLRVARGIQNKVLEGMAMEKVVIVSSRGLEGIEAKDGLHVLLADTPDEYFQKVQKIANGQYGEVGCQARSFVKEHFAWEKNLNALSTYIERSDSARKGEFIEATR